MGIVVSQLATGEISDDNLYNKKLPDTNNNLYTLYSYYIGEINKSAVTHYNNLNDLMYDTSYNLLLTCPFVSGFTTSYSKDYIDINSGLLNGYRINHNSTDDNYKFTYFYMYYVPGISYFGTGTDPTSIKLVRNTSISSQLNYYTHKHFNSVFLVPKNSWHRGGKNLNIWQASKLSYITNLLDTNILNSYIAVLYYEVQIKLLNTEICSLKGVAVGSTYLNLYNYGVHINNINYDFKIGSDDTNYLYSIIFHSNTMMQVGDNYSDNKYVITNVTLTHDSTKGLSSLSSFNWTRDNTDPKRIYMHCSYIDTYNTPNIPHKYYFIFQLNCTSTIVYTYYLKISYHVYTWFSNPIPANPLSPTSEEYPYDYHYIYDGVISSTTSKSNYNNSSNNLSSLTFNFELNENVTWSHYIVIQSYKLYKDGFESSNIIKRNDNWEITYTLTPGTELGSSTDNWINNNTNSLSGQMPDNHLNYKITWKHHH